jgi:osmotically-inducible protein OsmY
MKSSSQALVVIVLALPFTLTLNGFSRQATSQQERYSRIEQNVREALQSDRDTRRIEFSVEDHEITLRGQVQTFWVKNQAIKRTLAVPGVETVVSELEIPVAENDNEVAQEVAKTISRYPNYTIWDHIDGRINNGNVTLTGRVTPDWNKADDIFERVAKVKGVQDLQSSIRTLSPSQGDRNLRQAIASKVFSSSHFERVASMQNPPFHIIVDNSVVTLVGYVQSNIELQELQMIIAQTQGILRVDNQLQAAQ